MAGDKEVLILCPHNGEATDARWHDSEEIDVGENGCDALEEARGKGGVWEISSIFCI